MADIDTLPKPDGYAYRYPDGYIRHNHGHEVNGGCPTETLPWFYESTVRALCDRLSRELAEAKEKLRCYEMAAVTGDIDAEIWHQLATKLAKYLETRGVDPYTRHDTFKAVDEIIRQLAESERVSAARNKVNGELAMEGERLREAIEVARPALQNCADHLNSTARGGWDYHLASAAYGALVNFDALTAPASTTNSASVSSTLVGGAG